MTNIRGVSKQRQRSPKLASFSSSRSGDGLSQGLSGRSNILLLYMAATISSDRLGRLCFCDRVARLANGCAIGDSVDAQGSGATVNRVYVKIVVLDMTIGLVQNLSECVAMLESLMLLARHNRCVIKVVQDLASSLGENDLLLGALDHGGSVDVKGLLEFLTGDIGQLCLGDERFRLISD